MKFISPDKEYPRHIGDIQLAHPSYSEGDKLPEGWVQVAELERPKAGQDQITVEGFPIEIDGVMTQNWVVRDMTAEEIERRDAPKRAKEKLIALGLTEAEIEALVRGMIR